jgi:phytoene synthase
MKPPYPQWISDVTLCKKIHRSYGKSFYAGTRLFKKEHFEATCVLYGFVRFPDEYVDTYYADRTEVARAKLLAWKENWERVWRGESINVDEETVAILRATKYIFTHYNIPYQYSIDFIEAMLSDTVKTRFQTYQELENYMFGSATVVGLMMTYIVNNKDKKFVEDETYRTKVLRHARSLGEAFQMTNFLRDIGDDYHTRGRIYIPQEDLATHNVSENMLREGTATPETTALLQFEIRRTRYLYHHAQEGLKYLPRRVRIAIYVAKVLYSNILVEIEKHAYDTLRMRVRVHKVKRIYLIVSALIFNNLWTKRK